MTNLNPKKIVVVGGGAGGLELIVRLSKLAHKTPLEITLIDKQLKHLWKPLLHEVASGTYSVYQDEIDYISYAYQIGFKFALGDLQEINQENKFVTVKLPSVEAKRLPYNERKIDYDILILSTGSQVNDFNIPGVKEYCLLLDDLANAELFHQKIIDSIILKNQSDSKAKIKVSIIGGGATGVELAAELAYTLSKAFKYLQNSAEPVENLPFQITLIESDSRLLNMMPERISTSVTQHLIKSNIEVLTNTKVIKVTELGLETNNQQTIDSSITVWAAGVKVTNLLHTHSLELNSINQFVVDDKLQTTRDKNIFAFGDCASCPQVDKEGKLSFVPPRAQAAHQQARILAKSISNLINGKPLLPYIYKDYGSLISLSHRQAVGVLMGRATKTFYLEGKLARLTYWLLYKKHLLVLKGVRYVVLSALIDFLLRKRRPEVKLH
ncbi:NAD(P)/FAD-dependent oxidoreductase [Legionella sp. D16C41]|uniref:NAD(P)/FAD-dependent oxidoreductase n=1 Tax=Legionella sp. D16C41 TaxID=3402688 RepID=UPI003AF6FFD5